MDQALISGAEDLLLRCREAKVMVSSAESCTGGMIAAALTEVAGSSDVFERGFVTYSNAAKTQLLGVPADLIASDGAVSEAVARAMASGALKNAEADLALAVTGVAGPSGGTAEKPVGLVHIAAARGEHVVHEKCEFGAIGRSEIRGQTVLRAFALAGSLL